jgi:DNA-binding LytR/AlgR family response regulator
MAEKIKCLIIDDEPLAINVLEEYISRLDAVELVGSCRDAIEAINFLQRKWVDLLFLDIHMPEVMGTDLVRSLKNPPYIIFTTAHKEFALEGFELDAVDYLLKPISFERFLKAIGKVINTMPARGTALATETEEEFICFRSERKMMRVAYDDILYIESIKDYIKVVTTAKTIITKQSISSLEDNLPKSIFIRIHRSYIVAIAKINAYSSETVEIGRQELPVSRLYRMEVERIMMKKRI